MADGKRPGGLTALAVLNFVFAGFGVIVILGMVALLGLADAVTDGAVSDAAGAENIIIIFMLSSLSTALLITSGVGYLVQKRVLGRIMGSIYAIVSLLGTGLSLAGGEDFEFSTIISLIYPVLTLILVNTTFKDDLVN